MSEFLSRIKARLEPGQHVNAAAACEEAGWVRAALASIDKERGERAAANGGGEVQLSAADLVGKMMDVTLNLDSVDGPVKRLSGGELEDDISPTAASRELWETGSLKSKIPDGFYSVVPNENLKGRFLKVLPTFQELQRLVAAAPGSDVLLVDSRRDHVLHELKELAAELVKDLGANVSLTTKKIAEVVADFYGGPVFEGGSVKTHPEENLKAGNGGDFCFLGRIRRGCCRPRALLFKVLADHVGLPSRLLMGLQLESVPSSSLICAIPNKHLSNVVTLNGVEFIIDVLRHPGHLRPFSRKVLVMYHIAGAGDSDSADYDSCDSPLEPNSPLFGFSDRPESESPEHDMDSQLHCVRRGQSSPVTGAMMMNNLLRPPSCEGKLSPSQSEPDLANPSRRRHRRKAGPDDQPMVYSPELLYEILPHQGKLSAEGARSFPSSPEHPQARFRCVKRVGSEDGTVSSPEHAVLRARAPSMLSGSRRGLGEDADSVTVSSSPLAGPVCRPASEAYQQADLIFRECESPLQAVPCDSPDHSPQHATMGDKPSGIFRRRSAFNNRGENGRRERSLSVDIKHEGRGIDFLQYITEPSASARDATTLSGGWFGEQFRGNQGSPSEGRRMRKRSAAPEVSDEVVRAVRAMNEAFKQERRRAKEQQSSGDIASTSSIDGSEGSDKKVTSGIELPQGPASCPSGPLESTSAATASQGDSKSAAKASPSCLKSSRLDEPLMPYKEWNIDYSELRMGVRVGIGSFGEVFRGDWRGTEVAIKLMLEQDLTEENTEDFCNEISLLSRLRHPNVILFLGACMKPPHLSMVTEYMHRGSLYRLIHTTDEGKKLSWRRRLKMLRDICRGMMCVHRMNIIHRDLKSANCLVDKHWAVKICDFGLSRIAKDGPVRDSTAAGTPEWMAPELLRNEPVSEKCDIFSLGVIMWELCTMKKPWEGVKPIQVIYSVAQKKARLEVPGGYVGKLISDCWEEDPNARPGYEEILSRLQECEFHV